MVSILFISLIHIFFFLYLVILWIIGPYQEREQQDYSSLIPKSTTYYFELYHPLNDSQIEIGKSIEDLKISHIYFIHGTFVGDDPFDIISFIEKAFPRLSGSMISLIKLQIKNGQNLIARDLGNFHPNLIKKLKELCPSETKFKNFTWSSSNHHIARLRGAIQLMDVISKETFQNDRILLYGHSHAGQLFTLMNQLCGKGALSKQLKIVLIKSGMAEEEVEQLVRLIKTRRFDFVTLGTPVRYTWNTGSFPKSKLLHYINHRGEAPLGGGLTSSFTTRNGDYIQQWAVAGSDSKSPVKNDQELNEELDLILGTGSDVSLLRKNIKFKKRLHDHGEHYLVDFKDSSRAPNSFLTIFGHGVYTKRDSMLWIINHSLKKLK